MAGVDVGPHAMVAPVSVSRKPHMPPQTKDAPPPLVVHYSPWKAGAIALFIAWLCGWWARQAIVTLMAAETRTFHMWFSAGLGIVLTVGTLVGLAALFMGKTSVLVVDQTGVTASELYEDRIPWRAIGGITRVRGRGVVFQVEDGASYGRKLTRNVRASQRPSAPDMACIRSGLLDQGSPAILACMQAHQAYAAEQRKRQG